MTITLILFTIINIVLAFLDAHKIIKGKYIFHGLNALVFIGLLIIPYFIFHNYWLIGALLFNRLIFFNISLSLFRGLKWDYVSPSPKSVTDKLAKKIFGNNGKKMYAVYTLCFVTLTILSFVL